MTLDWYPGNCGSCCQYWNQAEMLQQTFATLEKSFIGDNDASSMRQRMVECCCRVIIDELDDPAHPTKPQGEMPRLALSWWAASVCLSSAMSATNFADLVSNITTPHRDSLGCSCAMKRDL